MIGKLKLATKALLKRRLDTADFLAAAGPFINMPSAAGSEWELLVGLRTGPGKSLLDGWRSSISEMIDQLAQQTTWELQRQKTLERIVAEREWVAFRHVVRGERLP